MPILNDKVVRTIWEYPHRLIRNLTKFFLRRWVLGGSKNLTQLRQRIFTRKKFPDNTLGGWDVVGLASKTLEKNRVTY